MARISQVNLPNISNIPFDIYGKNVQEISWADYQQLSTAEKLAGIAYYIPDAPSNIAVDPGVGNIFLQDRLSQFAWTQLISTTGGSWSAATSIPSGTEYLVIALSYNSTTYMPITLSVDDLHKLSTQTANSHVKYGTDWEVGTNTGNIAYDYDDSNTTISVYADSNTYTISCYALSGQSSTIADFTGATSQAAGVHGLVPAPSVGDQNKVLFGDSTWKNIFVPTALSQLSEDSTHRLVTDTEKSTWSAKQSALTFDDAPTDGSNNPVKSNGIYDALATKANISDVPTSLADLSDDSTHRVVTDTEKTTWNGKVSPSDLATVATSGSYADLTNTPTVDNTPTENSNNLVKSGGVFSSLDNVFPLNELLSVDSTQQTLDLNVPLTTVGGLNTDGTVDSTKTSLHVSDYIDIRNIDKLIFVNPTSTTQVIQMYCAYDSSKTFINYKSKIRTYSTSTINGHDYSYALDLTEFEGAAYFRVQNLDSANTAYRTIKDVTNSTFTLNAEFDSDTTDAMETQIRNIKELIGSYHPAPHDKVLAKNGMSNIIPETYTYYDNTIKTTSSENYDCTDEIPCNNGDKLYLCWVHSILILDENHNYLETITASSLETTSPERNWCTISNLSAKYMIINFTLGHTGYACTLVDSADYEIVNLGDSVFGLNPKPYDISSKTQDKLFNKVANCGFGGTTAADHYSTIYRPYSLNKIADCIADDDFTTMDEGISSIDDNATRYQYIVNLHTLEMVDFSKVKVITIAYGTNDFYFNEQLDNDQNRLDVSTFKGSLRYAIETISEAYPDIVICLCAPIYRVFNGGVDSDTYQNSNNNTLLDFIDSVEAVAREYKLPFFDHYNYMGINKTNFLTYLQGSQNGAAHPNWDTGSSLIGYRMASEIADIII